ncbi:MAG: hypothetical protein ACLR0A_16430 [Faecalibacillus intestinalis]
MLNMISINLDSITTQEAFIINKAPIDGKEMKLTLSRKCTQQMMLQINISAIALLK